MIILGLSALIGSLSLIYDPSGDLSMLLPLALLELTPFETYLIPGILLLIFNAVPSIVLSFAIK